MKKPSLNKTKIAFAGNGHGGIAELRSLISHFENIEVLTNDCEIKEMLRDNNLSIESLRDSKSKIISLLQGIWASKINFSSGSNCLVLASHKYNATDYIRGYDEFLEIKHEK